MNFDSCGRLALLVCLFISTLFSCGPAAVSTESDDAPAPVAAAAPEQVGKYVVEIFEDRQGTLWFGTLSKGVARYDGDTLVYWTKADGLADNAVVSIVEDREGDLWFATHEGLSRYDGESFTNYGEADGLPHFRLSGLLLDREGILWVRTWGGVAFFDGETFVPLELPIPDNVELLDYQTTMDWVTVMKEDPAGNLWFGRDGYGAARYDGQSWTHFTEADGLPSNNVQEIHHDRAGNVWFGTRVAERDHPDPEQRKGEGGLIRYDGKSMQGFPDHPGLHHADTYSLYEDRAGDLWVSTIGEGVYRYDGTDFTNYRQCKDLNPLGPEVAFMGIQSMLEDSRGNHWFGCSGGLFRLRGDGVENVPVGFFLR
ncbi:two-component regulator propeller domain-containing protein [Lewinella sp. W8]|uniref:ligand-binding sensor domain-containing protein n=1 Tax=Lewinella sp. W8 TaxID=2528208 RepID=UPI0015645A66|nr:two-component regulator propeller domain-containing protein [Lewinella sp. W8]